MSDVRFVVAPSRVLPGRWAVVDRDGTIARKPVRGLSRKHPRPAIFLTQLDAAVFASRMNRRQVSA